MASPRDPAPRPVLRWERLLAAALVLGLALPSIASIVWQVDFWPFSHYPMYSRVNPPTFRQLAITGITAEGEVDLSYDEYWQPFAISTLAEALRRIRAITESMLGISPPRLHASIRDAGERRMRAATRYLARLYDRGRLSGEHRGPPILGLRFSFRTWQLESFAANRADPIEDEPIAEVVLADLGPRAARAR